MDNNLKYLFIFIFILIWMFAIIIGYKKGKQKAEISSTKYEIVFETDRNDEEKSSLRLNLLEPKPILFKTPEEAFEPQNYSVKINNIEENFNIIDEKGNLLKGSQSEELSLGLFSLNIFDNDIKKEESLQEAIKFEVEEDTKEEHYKGMPEEGDIMRTPMKPMKSRVTNAGKKVKDPAAVIYTN
ncbi:MAG: hypothetical protein KKH98_12280 [Spirochaetes bacterium]|nr:hypothetical protein [Spirochaetota bacterium]